MTELVKFVIELVMVELALMELAVFMVRDEEESNRLRRHLFEGWRTSLDNGLLYSDDENQSPTYKPYLRNCSKLNCNMC